MASKQYKPIEEFDSVNPKRKTSSTVCDSTQYVLDRLSYLHGLKQHRYPKYWKFRNEYSQLNNVVNTEDGFIKYSMNTWFAIVNAKVAEIFASTPKYDFVGLDENGRKYKKMVEKLWDWVWQSSWTDKALTQIIRDSAKYWTGFGIERYVKHTRKVKVPDVNEWAVVTFKEEEVVEYEGCELVPCDWGNLYVNGSSIDNSTEAAYITHWDKDEFFSNFPNNGFFKYDPTSIIPWKNYYIQSGASSLYLNTTTDRTWDSKDNSNTISVIEYWNKYKDEYIIIANNIHINPYEGVHMPLPYPHKEIPIVCYTDHQVDGDIYGRGEYDITEKSRDLKDESRSLMIESIKIQWGIITIDPSSDFDETVERIWLKQFARVAKEDFGHFTPNINISPLELLESKLDEDIIVETWVDFRGQLFWPNETAERSKWRTEAARKRINSNIRENAYSFYARLARLRIENIKVFFKWREDNIPVKGFSISWDWVQEALSWDYGIMRITKGMLDWSILLLPIVDSITWDTSKMQKQKFMEFFQIAINMKKPDWSPLFDPSLLMDAGRWIIDDVVDLDKLLGWNVWIDGEINQKLMERWLPSMDSGAIPQWGWWVPPAQQSGKPIMLPSAAANITEG
jgi:hypothetical protein